MIMHANCHCDGNVALLCRCACEMLESMTSQRSAMTSPPAAMTSRSDDAVLDVAGLMLRGMTAVPVRLKILLDRLMDSAGETAVDVLHECGWTYDDYQRGYKLQVTKATSH